MSKKKELTEEDKIDGQILDLLMKKGIKTASEISNALNQMYGKVVQRLLDEEFNEFMEYEKGSHQEKKDENRRNGSTSKGKKVKTDNGEIIIVPPRDRDGSMYARGNSLEDIKETIREIYSIELSEETLSNMTKSVSEEVEKWQNRELENCYPFVYVDCLYCSVREDLRSVKKAIYVVLGIDTLGVKDVLGIWIETTETASKWCEIFEDLKSRGVEDIFFVSMDGLTGLPEAVERVYPPAIRKLIYTTNAIESINAGLRKVTKGKGTFINETALIKVLYLRIQDLKKKWSKSINNWMDVQNELAGIFEDRFIKYIEN